MTVVFLMKTCLNYKKNVEMGPVYNGLEVNENQLNIANVGINDTA